jgi:ribonuclease/clavin/mitogillin
MQAPQSMLEELPIVATMSPLVVRVLGHNPGPFTLQGTNTYIVGTGAKRLLIDTGEGKPEYLQSLQDVLLQQGVSIEKVR